MIKIDKKMCNIPDEVLIILQKDVAEIKVALLGNEYNPAGGLLCRTNELEKEFEKLKGSYEKLLWTAGGIGAGISFIVAVLVFLAEKVIG